MEDVVRTYDEWAAATERREKAARARAAEFLGEARFRQFKRVSKDFLDGVLTPEEYAEISTSEHFFGEGGGEAAGCGYGEDGDDDESEEEDEEEEAPLVVLIKSMPEEYFEVRSAALDAVFARLSASASHAASRPLP